MALRFKVKGWVPLQYTSTVAVRRQGSGLVDAVMGCGRKAYGACTGPQPPGLQCLSVQGMSRSKLVVERSGPPQVARLFTVPLYCVLQYTAVNVKLFLHDHL